MIYNDDTTTLNLFDANDNDQLLLLTGLERLEYFSKTPALKPKSIKDHFIRFFKNLGYQG